MYGLQSNLYKKIVISKIPVVAYIENQLYKLTIVEIKLYY